MSEVKYTPGPWRLIPRDRDMRPAVQRGPEGGFVIRGLSPERENADARLIAASPRMADYIAERAAAGDAEAISIMEEIHGRR